MAHNKHIIDGINKEINLIYPDRKTYLKLTEGFQSKLPPVIVKEHDGFFVAREDLMGHGGTKSRAGEFLMSSVEQDTVVYVMPRVGHAPSAIINLAKIYGKRVVLFAPACKTVSEHMAAAIEMGPDKIIWRRTAAMPNLNREAKAWAGRHGAAFLPFGLNHPYTIAGFVRIAEDMLQSGFQEPEQIWTVVSTGTMTRGLQIGFSGAEMRGVAVARNMKRGELGRTQIWSEPKPFLSAEHPKNLPPFDTVATYDAKGWKYMLEHGKPGSLFWNVAGELKPSANFDYSSVDSYRAWGENREEDEKWSR
jgi:1-aminocyclopropane-1-carboxylate deaminase/D-cysteine desulfhydrase-like pyridoxal-dependent ACC family enzyme